jgi:exosome complex protein LRP1
MSESDKLQVPLSALKDSITDLTQALQPLTTTPTSQLSSSLPLLDKAKLNVLAAYAISSLLFSALRLQGTDAKSHPVFTELNRTRQYFEKIKVTEMGPQQPKMRVDKEAVGRFVKAGLAGNERRERPVEGKRKAEEGNNEQDSVGEEASKDEGKEHKKRRKDKSKTDSKFCGQLIDGVYLLLRRTSIAKQVNEEAQEYEGGLSSAAKQGQTIDCRVSSR